MIQKDIRLTYTPRKFVQHPELPIFYVIEADNNTLAKSTRKQLEKAQIANGVNGHTDNNAMILDSDSEDINIPNLKPVNGEEISSRQLLDITYGLPRSQGHWASCIQVIDPLSQSISNTLHLEDNENAVSIACAPFSSQDDEVFLVVGTAKNFIPSPRQYECGYIHIYRVHNDGRNLEFIHKTRTEQIPTALLPFGGKLLAGVGQDLLLYDLGMKQVLRKAQLQNLATNFIVSMHAQGNRIIVADVRESLTYVVYRQDKNVLVPFADDTIQRWVTTFSQLDYSTSCGGDKFGNLWAVRVPKEVSDQSDGDAASANLIFAKGYMHGTPNRLDAQLHYYVNDVPTSIARTSLVPGGKDVIFWAGLSGTMGVLVPLESRSEVDYFTKLERFMREEAPPLAGRDHLIYRGYYVPVKGVVDGDLCERFFALPADVQAQVAANLGQRSVRDVEKRISEIRFRVAW